MRRRAEMSGVFDWLRKIFPPPLPSKEASGLPVLRPPQLPAVPIKEKKDVVEIFRSKPKELIRAPEGVHLVFVPPQKTLLPAEAPAVEKPAVKWEELIPREAEPTVPIAEALTKFLKPSTVYEASRYLHPSEWPFGEPPVWSLTPWKMPTTYEVVEYIRRNWDLNMIYEYVLNHVGTSWWRRQVAESAHVGEPAEIDVEQLTDVTIAGDDIYRFLKIPDSVIERYAAYGPNRLNVEVLQPMLERVEKALEVFRPTPVLRGWFEIEPDDEMNFWLRYKEAKFPQTG